MGEKYCVDCEKKISKNATRCGSCAVKHNYLVDPTLRSRVSRLNSKHTKETILKISKASKGKNNGNYKHGKSYNNKCIDCGEKITFKSKRCSSCCNKGKNSSNYIDGRSLEQHYCIGCNKKIGWNTKTNRCQSCAAKERLKDSENSPNWKGGYPKCVDCGKLLSNYTNIRCKKCFHKYNVGKNHPMYGIKGKDNPSYGKKKPSIAGTNNPRFGKPPLPVKGNWYKKIWLRSSWEVKYAKWLDKNKIEWEYEKQTFELPNETTYTPDFYLTQKKCYREVKGYWRKGAKEKYNLFKRTYPEIKIELIREKELKEMKIL